MRLRIAQTKHPVLFTKNIIVIGHNDSSCRTRVRWHYSWNRSSHSSLDAVRNTNNTDADGTVMNQVMRNEQSLYSVMLHPSLGDITRIAYSCLLITRHPSYQWDTGVLGDG